MARAKIEAGKGQFLVLDGREIHGGMGIELLINERWVPVAVTWSGNQWQGLARQGRFDQVAVSISLHLGLVARWPSVK